MPCFFRHGRLHLITIRQILNRANLHKPPASPSSFASPTISNIFFLLIISSTGFTAACSWFGKTQVEKLDRPAGALRVEQAIERAGGSKIWVKGGGQSAVRSSLSNRRGAAPEVLTVASSFDAVVSAIKHQAEAENLKVELSRKNPSQRWQSVEILLRRQNEFACRWRVREVPKLLRAAIVIDDLGQDLDAARKLLRQRYALTFSILPNLVNSVETAREVHNAGREVMLHLPMEPEPGSGAKAGPGEISVGMPGDAVAQTIRTDLSSVPFAAGVNNHMGSRATANPELMAEVMRVLVQRGLYFVDSRTTAETNALDVARRWGLPAFYRSVFLDDTQTVAYTLQQLRAFRHVVEEQGVALAIGHPHPTTIDALAEFLPELERDDIQLVPASQLVHLPEAAHIDPPHRGPDIALDKNASRLR